MLSDKITSPFFEKTNMEKQRASQKSFITMVCGGPNNYHGKDMKAAHAGMDINKAQFNALVEVLQVAMDARNIPFATQNQLLARLAPMHRDVITVH